MISKDFLDYISSEKIKFRINEPMNIHTSFKIGGNADCFCEIQNNNELSKLILVCSQYNIPYLVVGLGSNLLVSDEGIRGVVIKLDGIFGEVKIENETTIYCGAGVSLAKLCNFAAQNSLSGLEFAWGIPGSVGGAIYMNAGAYGGEIKDVVLSSNYMKSNGEIFMRKGNENEFSYRHSYYSNKDYIITEARFHLLPHSKEKIYKKMNETIKKRKEKQPLNYPSAGSTFKRPKDFFAAALIEECGLKGYSVGGAQVSEKHSGFIINKGGATAKDVCELVSYVKKVVKEKKGINLDTEIKFVGENIIF